jgi:hypothetical protein
MSPPKLKHPPYAIFRGSRTPPGLYARQWWLNQGDTHSYKADFKATVSELESTETEINDRHARILDTIHRLFGLHLTVRHPNPSIGKALSEVIAESRDASLMNETVPFPDRLQGIPFAASHWRFFILPAALFMAAIFEQATAPEVDRLYAQLAAEMTVTTAWQNDAAAMHNALRALVVHPDNRFQPAIRSALTWFAARQTAQGDWGPAIPFYQAVNALAHLNMPEANVQFDRALPHIISSQNTDGTWDSVDTEWQTFLMVHALRNKGIL